MRSVIAYASYTHPLHIPSYRFLHGQANVVRNVRDTQTTEFANPAVWRRRRGFLTRESSSREWEIWGTKKRITDNTQFRAFYDSAGIWDIVLHAISPWVNEDTVYSFIYMLILAGRRSALIRARYRAHVVARILLGKENAAWTSSRVDEILPMRISDFVRGTTSGTKRGVAVMMIKTIPRDKETGETNFRVRYDAGAWCCDVDTRVYVKSIVNAAGVNTFQLVDAFRRDPFAIYISRQ